MNDYDIVILGGGPGGYVAAIRAAQLGRKTALVERGKLGGTCLHKGCIPSKALLRSAEVYDMVRRSADFGVRADGAALDMGAVQARKAAIVEQLHKGVQYLMKKNRIDVYIGTGTIDEAWGAEAGGDAVLAADGEHVGGAAVAAAYSKRDRATAAEAERSGATAAEAERSCATAAEAERSGATAAEGEHTGGTVATDADPARRCNGVVAVTGADGSTTRIGYRDLIVATGSRPRRLPELDAAAGHLIMTSDEALELDAVPASVLIVGGGAIGVEWASMLSDFGAQVTIAEAADRLVPTGDADVSRELQRLFAKRRIRVLTDAQLLGVEAAADGGAVARIARGGTVETVAAERLLVSVGREPITAGLGLEKTRARIERGAVAVDRHMRTDDPHIYAIGDVIGGLQLAHVASHEGIVAVERICGLAPHPIAPEQVPKCIYSRPEIASVGLTEQEAAARGHEVKIGKFSFKGIGKALVFGESDGFVKVVADKYDGAVLGVHMIGPHATDYIGEAALAQLLEATSMQVGRMMHPHPTLSEIIGEAMLGADGLAISM